VEFLEAAFALNVAQRPGVLVIGEEEVTCARGSEEWELERKRGGYDNESEARVRIRKTDLSARPEKRMKAVLDGRNYTVDDVSARAGDVAWSVTLLKDGGDV